MWAWGGGGHIPHMALKHFYNSPARAGWWVRGESVPTCLTCHHMNSEPDKQNKVFFLLACPQTRRNDQPYKLHMINNIRPENIWPLAWLLVALHTVCVYKLGCKLSNNSHPHAQAEYPPRTETITTSTIRWEQLNQRMEIFTSKHDCDDILIKQLQGKSYMCKTLFSSNYLIKPKIYLMTARLKITGLQINSTLCRQALEV